MTPGRNYWRTPKRGHLKTAQLAPKIHVPPVNAHPFVASGQYAAGAKANDPELELCARCDSVRRASIHRVPELSEDAREIDARRIGEGTPDD